MYKKRDRMIETKGVNIPWIAEKIEGMSEKTVKRYVHQFLKLIDVDPESLRGTDNQLHFDLELADMIVWFVNQMDSDYIRKLVADKPLTLEDAIKFQQRILVEAEKQKEPLRSELLGLANTLQFREAQDLFARLLERAQYAAELVTALPTMERYNVLTELEPRIEHFIKELEERVKSQTV